MGVRAVPDGAGYWVEAAPFRAQLHHLMGSTALTAGEVAAVAGISARLAERLVSGRNGRALRRISRDTGRRLMALSGSRIRDLRWTPEPAGRARWQLQRLRQAGWADRDIARRVNATTAELDRLSAGAETCSVLLAVRLVAAARAEVGLAWAPPAGPPDEQAWAA